MLTFDVKRKINTLRDILVGKVPDPKAQVEQITIALIYKFMDDMDIEGLEFGGARQFFTGEYEKYAWTEIMKPENSGQQRALLYAEGIEKMTTNPNLPQLFRDIFRGAYIPYRDPDTLNMFLKEVSDFSYDNSEDLGNAFEYLLSIMGSQGDAGQFRTPRHIIDMMVEIVDPKKNETILDPACGTAGFLISAYRHILAQNKDEDGKSTLTADDRKRLTENFAGYDISPDMVRLSRVNMYLHHFTKPKISEYDTLTSEEKWDDCYDVIFANPPFMTPKGGIMPHSRYRVKAKRSEVLFVDYIAEHLNPNGRAAIIVPEGIIFQSSNAYKELRKYLVNNDLLYAVISLPAGVFNPYSGVKTSILLIDKLFSKFKDEILFVKLNNDGFDLGAQRQPKKGSEISEIVRIVKKYHADLDPQIADDEIIHHSLVTIATKEQIAEQDYVLVGERYLSNSMPEAKHKMVSLGDKSLFRVESGGTPSSNIPEYWDGNIRWATLVDLPAANLITELKDKEFWTLKTYSHERVERLCRANGQFESVENVFDSSTIPEQTFIDSYLGVFSWHANKRSEVKEFVDKRDRCAHNSGFIQYDQEAVGKYFDDVLKNIEKIASANAENIQSTFKSSIMRYINSPAFQTTSMGDFIQRELADKKYSYRDICAFLTLDISALPLNKKIAYLFAMIYFQEKCKQDNFQEYIDEGCDYIQQLSNLLSELSPEEQEQVRIQVEYEVEFLEGQGFDLNEVAKALPTENE